MGTSGGRGMMTKDRVRLIGLSLLWGGSFFFVALARPRWRVVCIVWGRVAFAALFLAAALAATRGPWPRGLSLVMCLNPVLAILLGFAPLSEPLAARQLAGFTLIAVGLAAIDGRVFRWR
jgi:drug/metabolite transporter (DMT)-like permease